MKSVSTTEQAMVNKGLKRYDLVVFDMAGTTVVDEGDVVAVALVRALKEVAATSVTVAEANGVMGLAKPLAITSLITRASGTEPTATVVNDTHERFRALIIEHYKMSPAVREIEGASDVFRRLREAGVKVALDTGFSRDIIEVIVERLGWRRAGLIAAVVGSDEVVAGRPTPFLLYRAMELTGVTNIKRVVKIGDTPSDLHEGTNAGCARVVGVTRGSHTRQQLIGHPHTDLIGDISSLIDTLELDPRPAIRLHTPGPANTSSAVRQAMMRDVGAWDKELTELVAGIRREILSIGGVNPATWDSVLLQGSGTFGVEAVIGSAVPRLDDSGRSGKLLVASNGAYGERMIRIAESLNIPVFAARFAEDEPVNPDTIEMLLTKNPEVTTVAVVHCETTTGLVNDVEAIGRAIRRCSSDIEYVVDAMSSFGVYSIDWEAAGADWVVASSNKCLQGTPGLAIVLARRQRLELSAGRARSLAMDLFDQWRGFETHGRFRFTPPTHVLSALKVALAEHRAEGGIVGRRQRYQQLHERLVEGMTELGYQLFLPQELRSCIITTFLYPGDPKFSYAELYQALQQRGFVIYPGKLTSVDSFRIGHIGDLALRDIDELLLAFAEVASVLGYDASAPAAAADIDGGKVVVTRNS